jgi:hypothetical protein
MFRRLLNVWVAYVAIGTGAALAAPPTSTWEFALPVTEDLSIFGRDLLLLYFGPDFGSQIVKTRVVLEFETDGTLKPSDLILQLSPIAPVDPWILQGDADFHWPTTAGTFTAVLETDIYNGPVVTELWEVLLDAEGEELLGGRFLNNSRFELDYIPAPEPASLALLGGAGVALQSRRPRRGRA